MAKFLTTTGTASCIEDIVRKALNQLTLITPYLKLSKQFEQRLKDANKRKVKMTIIYGKVELSKLELEKLMRLEHLQLLFCENLHAKCYINDETMVMSSMNLHEYSERYNREMGILFTKSDDPEIFEDVLIEVESIKSASRSIKNRLFSPKIEEPYINLTDFHLPLIQKLLEAEFPDRDFYIEDSILKCDYTKGLRLHVDQRAIFRFDAFDGKAKLKKMLDSTEYNARCFWNEKTLHFYLPKGYQPQVSEGEQEYISEYLLDFIKTVAKFIN